MPELFSVQMNIPDTPNVQIEQSASTSTAKSPTNTEKSFNSILQQALPKEAGETLLNGNSPIEETATSTHSSLLPTDGADLQENILQLFAYLTNSINKESNSTVTSEESSLESDALQLLTYLTNTTKTGINITDGKTALTPNTTDGKTALTPNATDGKTALTPNTMDGKTVLTPNATDGFGEVIDSGLGDNDLINFFNTSSSVTLTENTIETLKDIRTALAQINLPIATPAKATLPLSNSITPDQQDGLTFGAFTKNLGELQNLLTNKNGNDVVIAPQTAVSLNTQQQALLERIQSFIVGGQEAGTISIKNIQMPDQASPLRNPLTQFSSQIQMINGDSNLAETSSLIKSDKFATLEEGMLAPALGGHKQQLTGVRHDNTQQFYDAKTQILNVLNENTNLADNQKGETMNQPGSGFNQMTSINTSSENNGIFSMTNTNSMTPLTEQVTDPTKATMLPSGTVVQDHEVIQQLVERFQVNRRQQDTKIQLKLHPVELGKMEIDLTVKEGSIRANVVAQSQHVQEILERNIAKLRSVLEQQGFNVEDITVTSSTETTSEFNLFEQHLNNGDSSSFLNKNDNSENHTPFVVDEFQDSLTETSTGVNVQA